MPRVCVCEYACVRVSMYLCVSVYLCVCVSVCVYLSVSELLTALGTLLIIIVSDSWLKTEQRPKLNLYVVHLLLRIKIIPKV